jgi:hypothetical protein
VLRTVTCNGKRGLLRPLILVVVNRRGRVPCRVRHYSDVVRRSELLPDSISFDPSVAEIELLICWHVVGLQQQDAVVTPWKRKTQEQGRNSDATGPATPKRATAPLPPGVLAGRRQPIQPQPPPQLDLLRVQRNSLTSGTCQPPSVPLPRPPSSLTPARRPASPPPISISISSPCAI